MKKIVLGIAATIALGLVSIGAPAQAATPLPAGVATTTNTVTTPTDLSAQRYYARRGHSARRSMMRRGPVCTVRKEVRRGPMGRRVVRTVRVCR